MSIAQTIDEASVELAVVESMVATARHGLDTAVEVERVTFQMASHLKTVVGIVVAGGVVVVILIGAANGVKSLLDRRREGSLEATEALVDDVFVDDIG